MKYDYAYNFRAAQGPQEARYDRVSLAARIGLSNFKPNTLALTRIFVALEAVKDLSEITISVGNESGMCMSEYAYCVELDCLLLKHTKD